MNRWIAVSLGDVAGVGPEVTLKALAAVAADDDVKYLLLGDVDALLRWNTRLDLHLALHPFRRLDSGGRFFMHNPFDRPFPKDPPPGSPEASQAALASLRDGARRCLCGEMGALVTAPVNKSAIIRSGERFVGQTEFLADVAGVARPTMMLLGHDSNQRWLRVALATTHLPLRRVAEKITAENVTQAISAAARACRDLKLPRQRVGVCGLNPHAGEQGELGDEEITVIRPAVEQAREQGVDVEGPLAADTLFHLAYRGEFDAVVAMYHDQGLGPLKMVAFDHGVNWTLGLPFVRTSPDHGTAYDIAGTGRARASSMIEAIRLAKTLARL